MTVCGLFCECEGRETAPIPLTGVSVQVNIIDLLAEVAIEQRYVNKEKQPIEATYMFPIDEGAGVCKFIAEIDGRTIEGIVKETKKAEADYQDAIRTGHSAALLQEDLPDVFKAKVGNLAPGSGAKIRITYVTELKVEGEEVRFFLPTTIAPRYIPGSDKSSDVAKDLATINYTEESHYQVEFDAKIKMASPIKDVRSPTHQIALSQDPSNNATIKLVKLEKVITRMDRDLVLYIKTSEPNQPRLIHEKSPSAGTSAVMLSIVPSFKLANQKTELIFLVDRSGSMEGPGIDQAKRALTLFLHSLPEDCYVNIAGFGFSYEELYPTSRKYDQALLQQAKAYAEVLRANLGGTEIHNPLERIFQKPPIEGYLRQVFVLTDGEVSNADQVLQLVRRNNSKARVFALGLGSSASHHLVEGMARAGNGTALFASLEERLEKKVMQQLQDALQPSMTDVKIKWDGQDSETPAQPPVPVQTELTLMGFGKPLPNQTPPPPTETLEKKLRQVPSDGMIPPVFDGRHLVIYALIEGNAPIPKWGEITAASPVGPLALKVQLTEENVVEGLLVHRLAAKKEIQLLQDRDDQSEAKSEIIRLSCQYGLASRYASFVAVDSKQQTELKESWMMMKSRDIPVEFAHGWGGGSGYGFPMAMCAMSAGPPLGGCTSFGPAMALSASFGGSTTRNARSLARNPVFAQPASFSRPMAKSSVVALSATESHDSFDSCLMDYSSNDEDNVPHVSPKELSDDDKLMTLICNQKFDGSFDLETNLCQLLESPVDDVRKVAQSCSYSDQVWATVIALAYMEIVLSQIEVSWKLVAKKAQNWLRSQNLADETDCVKAAHEFIISKIHLLKT